MALDPQLLEILACPDDKGPLLYFEDEDSLYNPRLKRRYAIQDDIPIMLIDEAETVDDAEHERLLAKAEPPASSRRSTSRAGRPATRPGCEVLDTLGMFDLAAAPRAGRGGARTGGRGRGPARHEAIEHVVVLGMGGSGIAGDVLAAVAGPFMPVPVMVARATRRRRSWARARCASPSRTPGNTEETVEAARPPRWPVRAWWCCLTGGRAGRAGRGRGTPPRRPPRHPDAARRASAR